MSLLILSTGHSLWKTVGEPLLPREHVYPLLGGRVCLLGGGKGWTCPPQPGGRGGREVVAAVLRAPVQWQGGKGTGRTTLSWEENSFNHITIRNNEMYHHCSLNLFSKYLIFCQWNY